MKCYYCDSELESELEDAYYSSSMFCPKHRKVRFIYSSKKYYPKPPFKLESAVLWFIDIPFDHYSVRLDMKSNQCILWANKDEILSLNYIPDITPENVGEWVIRLLGLKAFS